MKNRKINLIIFALVFTLMVIYPMNIEAKTYYAKPYTPMMEQTILYPGDIIDFSDVYIGNEERNFYLFLNDEKLSDDCFSASQSCKKQYTVVNKMIYENATYYYEIYNSSTNPSPFKLNFFELEEDDTINYFKSEEVLKHPLDVVYYKTGDILLFTNELGGYTYYYVYDELDNLIKSEEFNSSLSQIYRFPKINNKDVYWRCEYNIGGIYGLPQPHFTPIEYTEPKIELKCDKNKLNYGEKTKCEICLECTHKMSKLNFSINQKNLKLSNISYLDGITELSNDNKNIKLSINDDNICNEKKALLRFEVEGTKDFTYLDRLSLTNIDYTDDIVTAKYDDLNSDLNIVSTKVLKNPETGIKGLFIIIPIIILSLVGGLSIIRSKNYEK